MTDDNEYQAVYDKICGALRDAPYAQRELLGATDETYAYLEERGEALTDDQYLGLKLVLSQCEAVLTRYFGM